MGGRGGWEGGEWQMKGGGGIWGTFGRADIQTNFCTVVMEGKQDEGVPLP